MPFPTELTTPPVTKMYLGIHRHDKEPPFECQGPPTMNHKYIDSLAESRGRLAAAGDLSPKAKAREGKVRTAGTSLTVTFGGPILALLVRKADSHPEQGAWMTITWEVSELANGVRVVTTPLPTAQAVSANLFVGT